MNIGKNGTEDTHVFDFLELTNEPATNASQYYAIIIV